MLPESANVIFESITHRDYVLSGQAYQYDNINHLEYFEWNRQVREYTLMNTT